MSQRKFVDVPLKDYIGFDDVLDGKTPDQVIEAMRDYKNQYAGRDIYFDIESYGYDGGKELHLRERRLETDKEYEKRQAAEALEESKKRAAARKKKDKEYAEYERLKKKFEDLT